MNKMFGSVTLAEMADSTCIIGRQSQGNHDEHSHHRGLWLPRTAPHIGPLLVCRIQVQDMRSIRHPLNLRGGRRQQQPNFIIRFLGDVAQESRPNLQRGHLQHNPVARAIRCSRSSCGDIVPGSVREGTRSSQGGQCAIGTP